MATTNDTPGQASDGSSPFDALARHSRALVAVPFSAAVVVGIGLILASRQVGFALTPAFLIGILLLLFLVGMGIVFLAPGSGRLGPAERLRFQMLILLGGVGFGLAALGLVLPFSETFNEIITGGLDKWREHRWALLGIVGPLLGGLVLMFVGLQLGRGYERSNALLRRLLYGYNAVVSTLVLLLILLLINILAYVQVRPFSYFSETLDWTASRMYSLNDTTKKVLADLQQPVKVYALLTRGGGGLISADVQTLLENSHAVNPRFTYTFLSRDLNRKEIEELQEKYKIPEPEGLLVVYGPEADAITDFIRRDDLFTQVSSDPTGQGRPSYAFTGENALLNALDFLASNKAKAQVYFTQGNGELDVKSASANRLDEGVGKLFNTLNQGNYELKELRFGPTSEEELKKADVVVIARPRNPFPADALESLRKYLKGDGKKKGKLVVLMDVQLDRTKEPPRMLETGLEGLLAEFNVQVNSDRIINLTEENPLTAFGFLDPESANPIAKAFTKGGEPTAMFPFVDTRSVQPAQPAQPPGPGQAPSAPYTAEKLVYAYPPQLCFSEKNLLADPVDLAKKVRKDRALFNQVRAREPLAVAVAVTESKAAPMRNPHDFRPRSDQEPVMIVFGDASWISNQGLNQDNTNLFSSCLSWLRGRADLGQKIKPAVRPHYDLVVPSQARARLLLLPGALMLLGIAGLACGVWVVRRR